VLLQTERYCTPTSAEPENEASPTLAPHEDEEQVGRDTNRSFVVYPSGRPSDMKISEVRVLKAPIGILPERKKAMQADLHDLIVCVLRRYPTLSYFQVHLLGFSVSNKRASS
jgi:hypothetical protein